MLAALFEWFLWLAAFIYCLVKVYQKAENKSTRTLAIVMMTIFTLLRYDFQFHQPRREAYFILVGRFSYRS